LAYLFVESWAKNLNCMSSKARLAGEEEEYHASDDVRR
jgi:hypothetical protein